MSTGKAYKAHRAKLWRQRGGLCHWCGIKTLPPWRAFANGNRKTPRLATLDHLLSRWETLRPSRSRSTEGTVLSCLECNQKRAAESHAAYIERTGKSELPSRAERREMLTGSGT